MRVGDCRTARNCTLADCVVIAMKRKRRGLAAPGKRERQGICTFTQLHGLGVSRGVEREQLVGIAVYYLHQRFQNGIIAGHTGFIVLKHVHLDQHAGPVFKDHRPAGVARRVREVAEALAGVVFVDQLNVSG